MSRKYHHWNKTKQNELLLNTQSGIPNYLSMRSTQHRSFTEKKDESRNALKINGTLNKTLTRKVCEKTTQQTNKQAKSKMSRRRRERGGPRTRRSQSNDNNYCDQPGCEVLQDTLIRRVSEGAWHFLASVLCRRVWYYRQEIISPPLCTYHAKKRVPQMISFASSSSLSLSS